MADAKKKTAKAKAAPASAAATKASAKKETAEMSAADEAALAAEQERVLGTRVAWALPLCTVVAALVVGVVTSPGPAILVLAAGALLGTIVLLWASLRTLGGDAPLSEGFATLGAATRHDDLSERKERVLRALKDLENERAIGKLDDDDFTEVAGRYRDEAKDILREIDAEVAPLRQRAEAIAASYLKKRGLAAAGYRDPGGPADDSTDDLANERSRDVGDEPAESAPNVDDDESEDDAVDDVAKPKAVDPALTALLAKANKTLCPACAALNDDDATFCKKCAARLSDEKKDDSEDDGDEEDAEDQKRADAS